MKPQLLLNLTHLPVERRRLLQLFGRREEEEEEEEEEEAYFMDYIPPARDAINLPRSVIYVLVGLLLVILATYAIVGHLIKDLMHDLADCLFGPTMVEDDSEEGREGTKGKWRHLREKDEMKIEAEKDGPLPGSGCPSVHPSSPVPFRSAIASSHPGGKRISTPSVTFTCPQRPQVASP